MYGILGQQIHAGLSEYQMIPVSLYPANISMLDQLLFKRRGSALKQRWCDAESETKSDVGFSTLHNTDTKWKQRCTTSFERYFNVDITLLQRFFNVASTISKPICLVISMCL